MKKCPDCHNKIAFQPVLNIFGILLHNLVFTPIFYFFIMLQRQGLDIPVVLQYLFIIATVLTAIYAIRLSIFPKKYLAYSCRHCGGAILPEGKERSEYKEDLSLMFKLWIGGMIGISVLCAFLVQVISKL